MSIEFIGTRGPSNPWRLSMSMVAEIVGCSPDESGTMLLRYSLARSQARPGLLKRGLIVKHGTREALTEAGLEEYHRLLAILREDDDL